MAVGVSAEANPWYSLARFNVVPGTANVYASAVFTWLRYRRVELRSHIDFGASVLLFDLVAARAGTVGLFGGMGLLGLLYRLSDEHVFLLLDPADVEIPIPHLVGTPFYYTQYRFTLGVRIVF